MADVNWKEKEGTIIHATSRFQDVIPALFGFLMELQTKEERKETEKRMIDDGILVFVEGVGCHQYAWIDASTGREKEDFTSDDLAYPDADMENWMALLDAINNKLPACLTCCTHPGDSSDIGIWQTSMIED